MTQIVVNSNAYSDDGSSSRDMRQGGFRQWLMPMIADQMSDVHAQTQASTAAVQVAQDAQHAAELASDSAMGYRNETRQLRDTALQASTDAQEFAGQSGQFASDADTAAGIAVQAAETATAVGPGWTPVLALVQDGARIVWRVQDFAGGVGSKPEALIGKYVGAAGYVTEIQDATDVRSQDEASLLVPLPGQDEAGLFLTNAGAQAVWGMPSVTALERGTAQPLQLLGIDDNGQVVGMAPVRRLDYSDRASLRTLATGTAIVRGLGVFDWDTTVGAVDIDDDSTLFAGYGGCWRIVAADPALALEAVDSALQRLKRQSLHADFGMTLTGLGAGQQVVFDVPMPGLEQGDHLQVTPGTSMPAGTGAIAWVTTSDLACVAVRNTASTAAALTPARWSVMAVKHKNGG